MKEWWSKKTKARKIIIIIAGVLIVGAICSAAGVKPKEIEPVKTTTESPKREQKNTDGSLNYSDSGVDKEDFATYCQENYITLKKLIPSDRDIALVKILDYNEKLWELGDYTKDGDPLYMIQWNGEDRKTDEKVPFTCFVSAKDKDHIVVHEITMELETIYGKLEYYDKNGELVK